MMLPEHRERILNHYREERQQVKPVLDDQEVQQIEQVLVISYNKRKDITLKLFDPFEEIIISGVVTSLNTARREVKLTQGMDNFQWIMLKKIIAIYQ
ncbi:YolD-like family protein [Paenibacillus polymyxa]|uniref:YolD-like family protein n=1 Tax=Paenibacillus polymyxa TaxID=1406 RepID=UPI002AB46588|nr:YolD-like family protein [Paenibacillus polymyxa]MDY7989901.1 YolD-like family protein [Paenibacillus polymyxa]MDY8116738.1 YolD-like family protein [Paenibacillus polymyxa]